MAKSAAFYSRADENYFGGACRYVEAGNTEKAAKMIAATGGALFKIEQAHPYAADCQTCIDEAEKDLKVKARPEPARTLDSLDRCDEICLGYPNYRGELPPPEQCAL